MTSKTTIPQKHYVTIQYRADVKDDDGLLGFASPYTKDAAFAKRKDTQDRWAYGGNVDVNINPDDDSISCEGREVRNYNGTVNAKFDVGVLFMSRCFPIIIDNVLTEGFKIADSVRRYGWGGGGNVVWRIADPRGFELEISSDNFARVIDCATLVNGVIQGKCIWGRDGSKNVLLPEASDVYQEAVKRTADVNTNIPLKDVQVGDQVTILTTVNNNKSSGQYLGKYFFLCAAEGKTETGRRWETNGIYSFDSTQIERYMFKNADGGYFLLSSPKITAITDRIETPLNKAEVAQEATSWISTENQVGELSNLILISPTKIKPEAVTLTLEPIVSNITPWPTTDRYYHKADAIICRSHEKYYIASMTEQGSAWPRTQVASMTEIKLDLDAKTLARCYTVECNNGGSYWNRYTKQIYTKVDNPSEIIAAEKFRLVVTANGITGKVYRLS